MSATDTATLVRVRLLCRVAFSSSVRIGSGEAYDLSMDRPEADKSKEGATDIAANLAKSFCLDYRGLPYVPASSLRGALAARFDAIATADVDWTQADRDDLFGCARHTAQGDDYGKMGALRVYDGPLADDSPEYEKRVRMAIDPITRTADDHHLFADVTLPAGTEFETELELDNVPPRLVDILATCIASFTGSTGDQLGSGKNLDRGRVKMSVANAMAINQEQFVDWLQGKGKLDAVFADLKVDAKKVELPSERIAFQLDLVPHAPLLPIDHNARETTPDGRGNRIAYTRRGDELVIAPSTIKGVFRHHCRRILLTKLQDNDGHINREDLHTVDSLLGDLFGHIGSKGELGFSEWTAALTRADDSAAGYREDHEQMMIAIDRFTGGGHDGKLFSALACFPDRVEGRLFVSRALAGLDAMPDWICGLAAFALHDAMVHGIAVGWGNARGFGRVTLRVYGQGNAPLDTWPQVLAALRERLNNADDTLESWSTALDEALATRRHELEKANSA